MQYLSKIFSRAGASVFNIASGELQSYHATKKSSVIVCNERNICVETWPWSRKSVKKALIRDPRGSVRHINVIDVSEVHNSLSCLQFKNKHFSRKFTVLNKTKILLRANHSVTGVQQLSKVVPNKMHHSDDLPYISQKSDGNTDDNALVENVKTSDWPWKRAKKVAVMISFSGKDYLGMQRNPPYPTIEEELLKAFKSAGVIAPDWYDRPQQAYFQRASRTDKGVSAIKMVISLRMAIEDDVDGVVGSGIKRTVEKIQACLPDNPQKIQINDIKRVTKNFNCKSACDARTYEYLIPTFAFHQAAMLPPPTRDISDNSNWNARYIEENECFNEQEERDKDRKLELLSKEWCLEKIESAFLAHENFRMDPQLHSRVNEVLQMFIGSHYYHNYTSGKLPLEPSSMRYITSFELGDTFLYSLKEDNSSEQSSSGRQLEFAVIKIKGQSFMLHQIRKMIGMAIAILRGDAKESVISDTWNTDRIDVPRAPGLGLMLEEVHYEKYNKRFGNDGIHEPLDWSSSKDNVEQFKKHMVYDDILQTEAKERSMLLWMRVLQIHSFEPRHFENIQTQHFDNIRVKNSSLDSDAKINECHKNLETTETSIAECNATKLKSEVTKIAGSEANMTSLKSEDEPLAKKPKI